METSLHATKDANRYIRKSNEALEEKNYVSAVQYAQNAFLQSEKDILSPEFLPVARKALQIANDVVVQAWTDAESCGNDLQERVKSGILYMLDNVYYIKNEEAKLRLETERVQLETAYGKVDPLWSEERGLELKLKALCDQDGWEIEPQNTAILFHQLGKIYMKRSPDKKCLVHASALLEAALTRNPDKKSGTLDIHKDIRSLNRALLKAAGAKSRIHDLHEVSQKIFKKKVLTMREGVSKFLSEVQKISSETDLKGNMKECIEYTDKIRKISSYVAEHYLAIISEISQKCIEILGEAPCKFSHFAMGSQPRETASMQLCFRSAIVLENNAKKSKNFEAVLEYFRWYSVVFEIIVIYFGESPLSAMGVPSLNDFGFHESCKNWFRDGVAPNSIQFESILQISGKFPTGMEMIKTPKEFLKLISAKESSDIKSWLTDMLSRTCYIAGSEGLLRKFKKNIRKVLYSESHSAESFKKLIVERLKAHIRPFSFRRAILAGNSSEESNAKTAAHKHLLEFIDGVCHLAQTKKNSGFDNIDALQKDGHITENAAKRLRFALSVTRHISLGVAADEKASAEGKKWNILECEEHVLGLIEIVGKWSFIYFFSIFCDLQKSVASIIESNGTLCCLKNSIMETVDIGEKSEILVHFDLFEDALSCVEEYTGKEQPAAHHAFLSFIRGICLTKLGRHNEANDSLNVCLGLLLSLPEADQAKIIHYVQCCIGRNMLMANQLTEARSHLYRAKDALEANTDAFSTDGEELYFEILNAIAELEYRSCDYQLSQLKCEDLLSKMNRASLNSSRLVYDVIARLGNCLFKLGHYTRCTEMMEKARKLHEETHKKKQCQKELISVLVKLADCYLRLNQTESAERYCKKALDMIKSTEKQNHDELACTKLMLSQCHLRQNKYRKSSRGACEAFLAAFDTKEPDANTLTIIQAAVLVILRCMKPASNVSGKNKEEDVRVTWESASRVFDAICEQTVFKNNQLERDKSVLVRAILKGLFDMNGYDRLLECCKSSVSDFQGNDASPSLLQILVDNLVTDEKLRDQCERDSDYLCRVARFCNVRDSFSVFGAIVVFTGWLFRSHKIQESSTEGLLKSMENWLKEQPDDARITVLQCAVKLSKHMVDNFVSKMNDWASSSTTPHSKVPFLDFVRGIYDILSAQKDVPKDLLHEMANLSTTTATCWMKLQNYEDALKFLNDALNLQEKLALNAANFAFLDSTAIIEDIGICLAKLKRWEEAKGYLKRGTAVTTSKRKSRAFDDFSMLQVRVNSAKCSFSVGNLQETALTASNAFHEGLEIDSDKDREESMMLAVTLVLKSALGVSVHAQAKSSTARFPQEIVRSVMDCAIAIRTTIENHADELGSNFTQMIESLYYACGNCHYVLNEYKLAYKCFKKSLRILRRRGQFDTIERPIALNIAKCLVSWGKFKRAEKALQKFLDMERDKTLVLHLHPSHAQVLLAVCSVKRHKYKAAFQRVLRAISDATATNSSVLKEEIAKACCNVILQVVAFALTPSALD